jgi:hypothetical protein
MVVVLDFIRASSAQAACGGVGDFDQAGNPLECDLSGRTDSGWGFSVEVPVPLKGCRPDPHGILILLSDRHGDRLMGCSGSYNALDRENVGDSAQSFIEYSLSDGLRYDAVQLVSRKKTRLGGLPAERIVIRYREKGCLGEMILDYVLALGPKPEEHPESPSRYDYGVWLETSPDALQQDRVVFERLLRSWRLEKPLL